MPVIFKMHRSDSRYSFSTLWGARGERLKRVTHWRRLSQSDGEAMHVALEQVRLKAGDMDVPLRSTPDRDGRAALEYHRFENVAGSIPLPPAR